MNKVLFNNGETVYHKAKGESGGIVTGIVFALACNLAFEGAIYIAACLFVSAWILIQIGTRK